MSRLTKIIIRLDQSCIPHTIKKDFQNEGLISTTLNFKLQDGLAHIIVESYRSNSLFSDLNKEGVFRRTNQKKIITFLNYVNPLIDIDPDHWSVKQKIFFKAISKKLREIKPEFYKMTPMMRSDGVAALIFLFNCELERKNVQISVETPLVRPWDNGDVVIGTIDVILEELNKRIRLMKGE